MEEREQHHLLVGTEVSAKYRGAFCEAKIKSVKKSLIFKVSNKKDGKVYNVFEDAIKGSLKIGSTVEAQLPEVTGWNEVVVLNAKDKSIYTVEFDDGDVRTLSRGSLCLQGVRHFAEGDTLDQLPLTDPENFGTPVLNSKRKAKRKVTQASVDHDDVESDDQKVPEQEPATKKKSSHSKPDTKDNVEEESDDKKREKWLADRRMGKLVLVEPTDKRKHWYPAVCVNPMCLEEYDEVEDGHLVVRSFKSGKFFTVAKCERLTKSNTPNKVEPVWKDVLVNSFLWEETGSVPDVWKTDLSDEEYISKFEGSEDGDKEEGEKRRDFLEQLYKFMDDRGTPITKAPVLGYKDLDLFLLYNLVGGKGGFHQVAQPSDWREIYSELGIPKLTQAAGHHAKMAYSKYLLNFEEYLMSFQRSPPRREGPKPSSVRKGRSSTPCKSPRRAEEPDAGVRRASRRRKVSESLSVADESEGVQRESKRARKSKTEKRDSDADDSSSNPGSDKLAPKSKEGAESEKKTSSKKRPSSGKKQGLYKVGDRLKVKYGKDMFKLYTAKVVDTKVEDDCQHYLVHYTGYNSRHDEWIEESKISGLQCESSTSHKFMSRRSKSPFPEENNFPENPVAAPDTDLPAETHVPEPPVISTSEAESEVKKNDQSKLDKELQEKSEPVEIRRNISSTPPPPPPLLLPPTSPKRAASVEKVVPEKQEAKSSESSFSDDKQEKTSPPGVPSGLFPVARRTSGRRSKSPAYLKESALYGLTKRKRNPSATNEPQANLESDQPADVDDLSSETSSKSFNSSTSDGSRSSPLTIWSEEQIEKNKKPERKRAKARSGEHKLSQIDEEGLSIPNPPEYDDFDENVPSIELEKMGAEGRKKSGPSRKAANTASRGEKSDENEDKSGVEADQGKAESSSENPSPTTDSSDKSKEEDADDPPSDQQDLPTGSKTLTDNTPPSTPDDGSLKKFSDDMDSTSTSRSPSSSGENDSNSSSPQHPSQVSDPKEEDPDKLTPGDGDERSVDDGKPPAGSDSEGEAKGRNKKNNKKKNKKRKRPDPPSAPAPLQLEDLAGLSADESICVMIQRMDELRRAYQQLKQEVSWIDRKRKRAKRKEQEASEQSVKKVSPPHKIDANEAGDAS